MAEEQTGVKDNSSEETPFLENQDVKEGVEPSSTKGAENKDGAKIPETVPYEALQAKVLRIEKLEKKLEELSQKDTSTLDDGAGESNWFDETNGGVDNNAAQPSQNQPANVQQPGIEEIEAELAEQLISTPLKALTPFIKQMMIAHDKEKKTAQNLPGYNDFQDEISKVPDNIVYQAMSNPEFVRALLAKERHLGKKERASAALASQQKTAEENTQDKNVSLQELKNKYIEEGRQAALADLNKKSGQIAEGAGAPANNSGNTGNTLDDKGKAFMTKLGITGEKELEEVANNLDAFLKG